MEQEIMYEWLFHYNPYEKLWAAFKREDKEKYFNGELAESNYCRAKEFEILVDYILKSKGGC